VTLSEIMTIAGVLLSAGAALERMRRIENSNRSQGQRIGRLEAQVTELATEKRVRAELEGRRPAPPAAPRPHRALGAPFESHVLVPRGEDPDR
jgi:hypothetical protein